MAAKHQKPETTSLFKTVAETPKEIESPVTGDVPSWLQGSLLRNGPGMFEVGPDQYHHLFDPMALIHKWRIEDGKVRAGFLLPSLMQVFFSSRYLRSHTYERNMRANRIVVSEFGTTAHPDPCKSLFKRYASFYFPSKEDGTDNALVNFMASGDQLYALTEMPNGSVRIDVKTLNTIDKGIDVKSVLALNTLTAHPHQLDDGTNLNIGTAARHFVFVKVPPAEKGDKGEYHHRSHAHSRVVTDEDQGSVPHSVVDHLPVLLPQLRYDRAQIGFLRNAAQDERAETYGCSVLVTQGIQRRFRLARGHESKTGTDWPSSFHRPKFICAT